MRRLDKPSVPVLATFAGLAVIAGLGAGSPAYAENESAKDQTHDVVEVSPSGTVARPHDARRDVVAIRTVNEGTTVRLVTRLRRLKATGFELLWRVRTDAGTWRVQYNADIPSTPFAVIYPPGDDEPSDCAPGIHRNNAHDRVALSVPRSCIGSPDWVRTGLVARHWIQFDTDVLLDDARRGDVDGPAKLGPRVDHG